ncbi:hypothetical protein CC77DRAFT_1024075 [Alternaria alternata]|uniref:Asteroid domain-containing protein n=1 Tax=Alternaria alternata TaxID=5599 RepID=A0A177D8T4_ALTAL|nr:hypothetical protein CC77DRAFT_1024075 [Alternaria alternata]XP_051583014.1 uncharacterized protein J4E82_011025 [Alternaria postmessia]KAI5366878.1 hypothetical protein J4E82_011025 [Alternaria postmessia]OAG16173.1 hypothetical protein CC77DRAFT_1024075 [Alternaria alternata]RYN65437.1 hypothetical protein AA0117_g12173 [Alternaria alternata]
MGIQRLARRLEPYATRYSSEQLDGYSAVVDGPALAYYAHKLALASAASASRIPSYADIVAEAIHWLASLEKSDIKVSAIYFDGALPISKRTERLSRTEANNRRVQQFRNNYATVSCPIPTYLGSISYAFLAPALQEALLDSPFSSKTKTVPGEADDWCALHAKENAKSIIFTSDTDLVLYDYSFDTLIVFLHDADVTTGIKAYSPNEISKQLQLKSLVPFAYALLDGPQDSSKLLAHTAQAIDQSSTPYVDFARRYVAKAPSPSATSNLPMSDVRISEYVHQALNGLESPFVYMPLLVEDPNQASAWNVGQDIRTIAYSLLARKPNMIVHEYRRKAQGISVQEISTYSSTDLATSAADLERQLRTLREWAAAQSDFVKPALLWPLFGLSFVLAELNTPPAILLVQRVLNGEFDNSWAFVHLTARMHAAIYSLRVLTQIIGVWLVLHPTIPTYSTEKSKLHTTLSSLATHMADFPCIPDVLGVPGQAKKVVAQHDVLKGLVEEIYRSNGAQVLSGDGVSNKKKKKMAREQERKKKKAEVRAQGRLEGSGFALLGDC